VLISVEYFPSTSVLEILSPILEQSLGPLTGKNWTPVLFKLWQNFDAGSHLLPGKSSDCGVTATDNRKFVEAVLWIARTGSPWRDLPESFGNWHRVYVRYNRWSHKGTWSQLFEAIAEDPDLEYLMVDGSIVRVHQHGAAKKTTT
jgi:transposase